MVAVVDPAAEFAVEIAPAPAAAGGSGFVEGDVVSGGSEFQRSRQAGEAAADDVGVSQGRKTLRIGRLRCGGSASPALRQR
jgi:hypothetical protein